MLLGTFNDESNDWDTGIWPGTNASISVTKLMEARLL